MEATASSSNREGNPNPVPRGDHIDSDASVDHHPNTHFGGAAASKVGEIIEIMEEDEEILVTKSELQHLVPISETNTTSLFSIDIHPHNHLVLNNTSSEDDVVYVAVGKSDSSMDALLWTLSHSIQSASTVVYLIHIFSDLKFIPSPFGGGMVPKAQVSPDLVQSYMVEDSRKRRELLTKYVDKCNSHLVQVETILIESDSVANAILELISVLNIRHLVVGISKSNLRKMKAGKGSTTVVADLIRQSVPQECELKIICQGEQLQLNLNENSVTAYVGDHSPISSSPNSAAEHDDQQKHPTSSIPFSCCFKA